MALNQCLDFFTRYPQVEREPFYDTAGSVKMVMEDRPEGAAAIASDIAAKIYGGKILKKGIEDDRQNHTRFFLLEHAGAKPRVPVGSGRKPWKTSLVFSTRNIPGALFRAISALALRDLNLTKIESRPLRGKPWEYMFYVDLLGHRDEAEGAQRAWTSGRAGRFPACFGELPCGVANINNPEPFWKPDPTPPRS